MVWRDAPNDVEKNLVKVWEKLTVKNSSKEHHLDRVLDLFQVDRI